MKKPARPDFKAQRAAGQAYYERWKVLQAAGAKPVVIARSSADWDEWRAYYRRKGLWAMLELMDDRTEKTVPTRSPDDFEEAVEVVERRFKDD